ncbi:hypothetical protein H0H92_011884 [Tricholoma furcatifolium]|nr:hypothetical protein H0H92_011884 [Tricholoma furcatifolium]
MIPTFEYSLIHGRYPTTLVNAQTLRTYQEEVKNLEGSVLDQWRLSKLQEMEARKEHANKCESWNLNRNMERSDELLNIRDERYEAPTFQHKKETSRTRFDLFSIFIANPAEAKIIFEGFEEEIVYLEGKTRYRYSSDLIRLENHKLVNQPKPLTERIWNNIKPPLTDFMQEARKRHLEEKIQITIGKRGLVLSRVLKAYASLQPIHSIIPPLTDVAIVPAFRTIIEDTPIDEEVTAVHFQEVMVNFPQIVAEWREAKDMELVRLVNEESGSDTNEKPNSDAKVTSLTLRQPGTFFECKECFQIITYPRVLVHSCCFSKFIFDCPDQYIKNLGSRPWTQTIQYRRCLSEKVRLILRNCDLDSLTHDVLEKAIRFECLTCLSPKEGRLLMRWPVVAHHIKSVHRDGSDLIEVAELNPLEEVLADILESFKLSPKSKSWCHINSWVCRACKARVCWSESLEHLKEK